MTNSIFRFSPWGTGAAGLLFLGLFAAGCDQSEKINVNTPKGRVLEYYKDMMGDGIAFDTGYAVDTELARRYDSASGQRLLRQLLSPYDLSVAEPEDRKIETETTGNSWIKYHHFSVEVYGKPKGHKHARKELVLTAWVNCIELNPAEHHYPEVVPGEYFQCALERIDPARCGDSRSGADRWLDGLRQFGRDGLESRLESAFNEESRASAEHYQIPGTDWRVKLRGLLQASETEYKLDDHAWRDQNDPDYVQLRLTVQVKNGEYLGPNGRLLGNVMLRCHYDPADLCRSDCQATDFILEGPGFSTSLY